MQVPDDTRTSLILSVTCYCLILFSTSSTLLRFLVFKNIQIIIIIIIIIIKNEKIRMTLCENAAGALYI